MPNNKLNSQWVKGTAFIQWKGTDVCMDALCNECGENFHIDGDFMYSITCPKCKTEYDCHPIIQLNKKK